MSNWQFLRASEHREAGWQKFSDYRFAAQDRTAPMVVAEINQAALYYPLGLVKSAEAGKWELSVLQGVQLDENIFVDSAGRWRAPYVPAHYRSYPFAFKVLKGGRMGLVFDESSGLISVPAAEGSTPLFNGQNEFQQPVQDVIEFLKQRERNRQLTQQLVDQLAEAGVVQPWVSELPVDLNGVACIDETRLRHLPGDVLSKLAQSGALTVAYIQLFSQARLMDLAKRAEQLQSADNLDAVFGEGGDELEFDFDS